MTKNLPKRKGFSWALLTACLFLLSFTATFAADITSRQDGNWNSASTWNLNRIPQPGDNVFIRPGDDITATANTVVNSITFLNTSSTNGILTVNSGVVLTVTGGITVRNASSTNVTATISGPGTINCASLTIGGNTTSIGTKSTILNSTISNLSIAGNLSLSAPVEEGFLGFLGGTNNATLNLNSGHVSVGGTVQQSSSTGFFVASSSANINLNSGSQSGTLILSGSTPFTLSGSGTNGFNAAGTNATVIYSGANQTIRPTTYTNLTLSGSGTKTLANNNSITVKGNWTNNGVIFNAGNNTVTFGGTTLQTIGGTSPTTFNNITINNTAGVAFEESGATSGLTLTSGKLFIRPGATLTKNTNTAVAGGPFSTAKYIVTEVNTTTGQKGVFRMNALNANTNYTFPVGTPAYYLPAIVRPVSTGAVAATVFTPLTQNGEPNGVSYSDLSRFVNAVWQINKVAGTNNGATITLNWDNALEGGYFAIQPGSDIGIRQFTGGTNVSGSEGDNGNNTTNTVSRPFDFFGSFVVSASGSEISLPVNFANVKATKKAGGVDVAFSNLTEEDVAVYHVERSTNGVQYQSIATIAPKANNNSRADYQYTDKTPVSGNNYYRIRAVETTGKQVFSAVVKVGVEGSAASLTLYPNPASKSSGINLQLANLPAGVYSIRLFNSNGQVIGTKQLQHNGGSISESLPLNGAAAGRYVVDVKGAVQFTQSFLLQ